MQYRQPIFNVPGVVLALIGAFVALHVVRSFLPPEQDTWLTAALAFIPARASGAGEMLPGGEIASITSYVTHVFVHGDITHLLINCAWLLAFGSPVARRTGAIRFLAFFFLCGAAGALFYLVVNGRVEILLIGASGAISGLMGAAFRFLFAGFDAGVAFGASARHQPLTTLKDTLSDQRVLLAIAGWTILNLLLAWGATGLTEAAGIAWEAHVGGFFAGLLLYGFFDRPPPVEDDAEGDAAPAG